MLFGLDDFDAELVGYLKRTPSRGKLLVRADFRSDCLLFKHLLKYYVVDLSYRKPRYYSAIYHQNVERHPVVCDIIEDITNSGLEEHKILISEIYSAFNKCAE